MSLNADDMRRLLEVIFPGLVMLILVGGVVFRLAVKPTIDAILALREGLRSDRDQSQKRIARLEDEVARLSEVASPVSCVVDELSWSKDALRPG